MQLSIPTKSQIDQFHPKLSERSPGTIEDLTDLLAEDWSKLGSVRDMGEASKRFFRAEMEQTWGHKHLAVLDENEAQKWLLGVRIFYISLSRGRPRGRSSRLLVTVQPRVRPRRIVPIY